MGLDGREDFGLAEADLVRSTSAPWPKSVGTVLSSQRAYDACNRFAFGSVGKFGSLTQSALCNIILSLHWTQPATHIVQKEIDDGLNEFPPTCFDLSTSAVSNFSILLLKLNLSLLAKATITATRGDRIGFGNIGDEFGTLPAWLFDGCQKCQSRLCSGILTSLDESFPAKETEMVNWWLKWLIDAINQPWSNVEDLKYKAELR